MKALVKTEPGVGLALRDVPEPVPGREEVLIRVRATGICGTDVHIWDWDQWSQGRIRPPLVTGHEFVGDVVAAGS